MLQKSTIQLLRFPFSYFLMPIYWFALNFVNNINWQRAAIIFFLIHVLLYPSSNGYNSFMDKDTTSIGGIKNPLQPTKQLFIVTVVMDILAAFISIFISKWFAVAFITYIIFSRLYSYRGIRLKKYAILGYLTVIANQGAVTFFMVYHGASASFNTNVPINGLLAASCLIGGFYPITQVYQHAADKADKIETISIKLGIKGTFIFCACLYLIAFALLFIHYQQINQLKYFIVLQIFFIPVLIYFLYWVVCVFKQPNKANFTNTIRMNWLASTCTNAAFITLLIMQYFE
jgi:1,4-dihydroxy-2-naphthoate polyprenyltransferase